MISMYDTISVPADDALDREFLRRYPPLGGHPALDFANTVAWRLRPDPTEGLPDYPTLLRWARLAGLVETEDAERIAAAAAADPAAAEAARQRATALREAIDAIFVAVAGGDDPPVAALDELSRTAAEAAGRMRLLRTGDGFAWGWPDADAVSLDRPALEVSWKAARLLLSQDRERVRRCGGDGCGWMFLDQSRNRSRRWCDMAICGNRARVKAHYRRTHPGPAAAAGDAGTASA